MFCCKMSTWGLYSVLIADNQISGKVSREVIYTCRAVLEIMYKVQASEDIMN